MNVTGRLVNFCHGITYESLPEEVRDRAKYFLLDFLGVALRASEAASSRVLYNFARKRAPQGPCTVIGSALRTDAPHAALVNGGVGHAIEMDDVTTVSSLHPGVSVMPTALAAAEVSHGDPRRVISAIVAGYEVTNRVGNAVNCRSHYARGFHPTATCGTFGAAVVASKVLGLSLEATLNAFGIAGSQAAGSMQYLDNGAWTKRFHPGWAAHSGILAAYLAQEGYTGPADILGGTSGFLHGYSDESYPESLTRGMGEYWEIQETAIKPHACCRYNHASVDCTVQLCTLHDIQPEEVEGVEVRVPKTGLDIVSEPLEAKRDPKNVVDAQFSLPYAVAVAILRRRAGLEEYSDDFLRAHAYAQVIPKVRCVGDEELEAHFPDQWSARVSIRTRRGTFSGEVAHPKGDKRNPLTWEELEARFRDLTRPVLEEGTRGKLIERVRGLERLAHVQAVTDLLRVREKLAVR